MLALGRGLSLGRDAFEAIADRALFRRGVVGEATVARAPRVIARACGPPAPRERGIALAPRGRMMRRIATVAAVFAVALAAGNLAHAGLKLSWPAHLSARATGEGATTTATVRAPF